MRFSEVEGNTQTAITKVARTWEGVEVTFGGVYTLTVGKKEWEDLRDLVERSLYSTALL